MPSDLNGLTVVSFESRRSDEMGDLIERLGGRVLRAPSMRELPVPTCPQAEAFGRALLAGELDGVILLTGVGTRGLLGLLEPVHGREALIAALSRVTLIARGPKPVAALREWGLKPAIVAPEPNTWRELIAILDKQWPVPGKRLAVQEYGEPNPALEAALGERGAQVSTVAVYAWALPEDLGPLREGIAAVCAGRADVVVFTSAQQIRHVLQIAGQMGVTEKLSEALRRVLIGSVGPTTTETLRAEGWSADYEPDRPKMGDLVRGLARSAGWILARKRHSADAGIDTLRAGCVELRWPTAEQGPSADPLHDSAFLRACRRESTPFTPIWLMRQAGRYQRSYRQIREKASFLEMCKRPELAAEVTVAAVDQLGVDAAIIFADILLIAEPMGCRLSFNEGEGPRFANPVRTAADIDELREVHPEDSLSFVYEAIRLSRRALPPHVPLIGFSGAPFTVASYIIEGRSSRDFRETKMLMYRDPRAWHALMDHLVFNHVKYLNGQIDAGVQALQIFDSWVGCLNETDYRVFVLPHMQRMIRAIKPGVPIIHFGTNTATILKAIKEAGGDVIGLDWRMHLPTTWEQLGHDVAVQGNLDPVVLFATPSEIRRRAEIVLDQAAGHPGHIFNLGHGILPETPVEHAIALIDAVHEHSRTLRDSRGAY